MPRLGRFGVALIFPNYRTMAAPGSCKFCKNYQGFTPKSPRVLQKTLKRLPTGLAPAPGLMRAAICPADLPRRAAQSMSAHIDRSLGGLAGAPKFPQPFLYQFLAAQAQLLGDDDITEAVRFSLSRMCAGGLYDHIGGGFARYSVDAEWLVPHFEKMLYDNALLIQLMCDIYRQQPDPIIARRIADTIDWLARDMQLEGGAFAASLDADTEGEEGRFYVWSKAEISTHLGAAAEAFCAAYGITEGGNFEGHNIANRLHITSDPDGEADDEADFDAARATLLAIRHQRVRPGRDDKILADWNAMAIAALCDASALFDRPDWAALAETAFAAMRAALDTAEGGLAHSARNGQQLDLSLAGDLAFGASAACGLATLTGNLDYLAVAEGWAAHLQAGFIDTARGAYFANQADTEGLLVRNRPAQDNAAPAPMPPPSWHWVNWRH